MPQLVDESRVKPWQLMSRWVGNLSFFCRSTFTYQSKNITPLGIHFQFLYPYKPVPISMQISSLHTHKHKGRQKRLKNSYQLCVRETPIPLSSAWYKKGIKVGGSLHSGTGGARGWLSSATARWRRCRPTDGREGC